MRLSQCFARAWSAQFVRFAVVGTAAFLVDAAVLYVAVWAGLGLYSGRIVSYLVAATFTWYGNRRITFDSRAQSAPAAMAQWIRFLLTNLVGGAVNYAVYAVLVSQLELVRAYPVIGVAAGSIAGLGVNFTLSRWLVFREPHVRP